MQEVVRFPRRCQEDYPLYYTATGACFSAKGQTGPCAGGADPDTCQKAVELDVKLQE
jgi:hypothetical protein